MAKTRIHEEDLRNLRVPTLVIHGREDQIVPLEEALRLQNLIPKADLHIYEETGHLILAEQRQDFYARVDTFFKKAG